jgi:hypothetical protein
MKRWPFYFAGRGGVLGHVGPEVVHAVFYFFPFENVREQWATARDASRRYFQWPEPYDKPDDATRRSRKDAEEITDELASRAYRGLTGPQSRRLAELLTAALAAAGSGDIHA